MTTVFRYFKRALVVTTVLLIAVAGLTYFALTRSLPQLDGATTGLPLTGPVTLQRDASGITTIRAANRRDLAFATGYAHAQDRFFQMDLMRRQAAGELAALAGSAALDIDKRNRLHRFRSRAQRVVEMLSERERSIIEAYTAGVNAGIDRLDAQPFEYLLLRTDAQAWRTEDSILIVMAMFLELNDERARRDVQRGLVNRLVPQAVFDWLYPQGTSWDSPLQGAPRQQPLIPDATQFNISERQIAMHRPSQETAEELLPGSNNWAVSGEFTSTGRAIVANDMHLNIRVPNTFYRARLIVNGDDALDVSGVTLPGTPVVTTGSNGKVAWGFTNSNGDWTDAVLLQPGRQVDTYLTPDGERTMTRHNETIEIKGAEPFELLIRETIWGPVLDDQDYPDGEVAVSWTAHAPEAINLGHLDLEVAATVSEAISAANRLGIPPQNFVVGDADGNIGWTIAGKIPRRVDYDSNLPADWSREHGWQGWLLPDEYPRIINPPGGRIWTANTRVVDGEDLYKIRNGGYALGARGQQIRDSLQSRDTFETHTMLPIQTDDRALFLARWQELLISELTEDAMQGNEGRRDYRRLVADWTPGATANSSGYRLVRAFRSAVRQRVFDMLMQSVRDEYGDDTELRISNQFEGTLWSLLEARPAHMLSANYADWSQLLLSAVDENFNYYADNYAGSLADRTWGERNAAAIRHPLSRAVPLLSGWLDMPIEPLDGDSNMPRAQRSDFGASERFAVSPGAETDGYLHMPTGQSGHPLSDFYRAGHADWVNGRATPFLPGPPVHTLTLVPE